MQQTNQPIQTASQSNLLADATNIIEQHTLRDEPIKISELILLPEKDFESYVSSTQVNLVSTDQVSRFIEYIKIIKDKLSPAEQLLVISDHFETDFRATFCKDLQNVSLEDSLNELRMRICYSELTSLTESLSKKDFTKSKKALIFSVYFADLLCEYFHYLKYSVNNKIYLMAQMLEKSIPPSRIKTFNEWKKENIYVNKGEKALGIIVPKKYLIKQGTEEEEQRTSFIFKRCLFAECQTNSKAEIQQNQPIVCKYELNQILIDLIIKNQGYFIQDIIVASNIIYAIHGGIQENPAMVIKLIQDEKTSMTNIIRMIDSY